MLKALGFPDMATWGPGCDPLLIASLSHHGRPAQPAHSGSGPSEIWLPFAGYDPVEAASLLYNRIRAWFPAAFEQGPPLPIHPRLYISSLESLLLRIKLAPQRSFFLLNPAPDPDTSFVLANRRERYWKREVCAAPVIKRVLSRLISRPCSVIRHHVPYNKLLPTRPSTVRF